MANPLGRIINPKTRAMKPRADLHPIELLDSIGKDARAEALADTSQAPPGVTSSDKTRVVAQEMLDNEWDGLLGKMGRGFVAQRVNAGSPRNCCLPNAGLAVGVREDNDEQRIRRQGTV